MRRAANPVSASPGPVADSKSDPDKVDSDTPKERLLDCTIETYTKGSNQRALVRARLCEVAPGGPYLLIPFYLREISGAQTWNSPHRGEPIPTLKPIMTFGEAHDVLTRWASTVLETTSPPARMPRRLPAVRKTKMTALASLALGVGVGAWHYWHDMQAGAVWLLEGAKHSRVVEQSLDDLKQQNEFVREQLEAKGRQLQAIQIQLVDLTKLVAALEKKQPTKRGAQVSGKGAAALPLAPSDKQEQGAGRRAP